MNITPSTMASAVRASRSLWASSPLIVTFHTSGPQRAHVLENRVRRWAVQLVHDVPVSEEDHPVGVGRAVWIVRDHDDGLPELGDGALEEAQHLLGRVGVEVAGGFVGEDQVGTVDQGPGTGTALLLATRQLTRPMGQAIGDSELIDQVVEPVLVDLLAGQVDRAA